MQSAVIEYARNVLNYKDANSVEANEKTPFPVIDLMKDQKLVTKKGGTMRLGSYDCQITKDSNAYNSYRNTEISERHRHRFEFNNKYQAEFEKSGMIFSGINPEN